MAAVRLSRPIRGVDYDPIAKTLTVRYQVGTYQYHKVPESKAAALTLELLAKDDAALNYIHAQIAGKYHSERTGE